MGEPRVIVVWSDIACPWATSAVHQLVTTRDRLGMRDELVLDHRAFPLEVINGRPTPKRTLDAEIPVAGALAPEFGFRLWEGPAHEFPVSTLLALEAVQAAKAQSLAAGEALDLALRRALFAESRCITMRHVVLDVAARCRLVDAAQLEVDLDHGRYRALVLADQRQAATIEVKGSPHLFLPDGTSVHNPGVELHWEGGHDGGFPVVDEHQPGVYDQLVRSAAA